jgi:UPF0716 protein FxsA
VVYVLLIGVPLLELFVFVQVANAIGFLNALGLAILVSLVGLWLVKRAGVRTLRRFQEDTRRGKVPDAPVVDGFLLLLAGGLLLFPGFVTGAVGLLLLLPPVRALARRMVLTRTTDRVRVIRGTFRRGVVDTTATDGAPTPPPGSSSPAPSPPRGELEP